MPGQARRFIYYVAASADGFIARSDGRVDWLDSRPAADYDFAAFTSTVDTIVWGRRTFDEAGQRGGVEPFGDAFRHVVVSRRPPPATLDRRVEFSSETIPRLVARLRRVKGKDIWIMGGATLAGSFADAGAIDEIVVHQIPVLLGKGIPLLATARDIPLRLLETHAYPDGVLRLRYGLASSGDDAPTRLRASGPTT